MFDKHTDSQTRIEQWRDIRKGCKTEEEILESFASIKVRSRYLDYYTPADWYNPFEIVEHGFFCTTGISLLLYYTLQNLNYIDTELTEWKVISNHTTGQDGAVFCVGSKYYNVIPGKVCLEQDLDQYCILLKNLGKVDLPKI